MSKLRKSKYYYVVALTVILVMVIGGVSVLAASVDRGLVQGKYVKGISTCGPTYANGSTAAEEPNSGLNTSVSSTYGDVNMVTYETHTQNKSASGQDSCGVSFTAYDGCQSVSIYSSHYASKNGSSWSGSTSQTYPNY